MTESDFIDSLFGKVTDETYWFIYWWFTAPLSWLQTAADEAFRADPENNNFELICKTISLQQIYKRQKR